MLKIRKTEGNLQTKRKIPRKIKRNGMIMKLWISLICWTENTCLWDIFHKDYSKCDVKEIAYTNMATAFETNVSSIKTKINGLRAQLGREKTKQSETKSGQSVDELYESSWVHYNHLAFFLSVIGSCKNKETYT